MTTKQFSGRLELFCLIGTVLYTVSLQNLTAGMIYLLFVYNPPPTERHTWKPKREQKRGSIARVTLLCNYPYTAAALYCLS